MNITRDRILQLIQNEFESDAAFEREMNLPSKTVNNWRRSRSSSYMKMLPVIAERLGVNVGELLDIPIQHDTSELSVDEIALLSVFRRSSCLSGKQRKALVATLEQVIDLYVTTVHDRSRKKDVEV